ncbi:MAG TPA: class I SAM-dependent methyltransferase [Terriglobales bacterium]|nr:class I SAM-dependent methyltransferase [Terriglobales bacterium]
MRARKDPGPGWLAGWREKRRQGVGTLGYRLLRRVLDRGPLAGRVDVRIHQVIAVAPWRLRLPPRLARGLRVREVEAEEEAALRGLRAALGMEYGERFRQAHRCVGAWLEQRLVAFVWMRRGPAHLPASFGCAWQLTAPMAWLYDLYSDPEVLGAIPHLYAYLRQHPPGEGLQEYVGQTDYDNWRSRRAHRSLGYEVRATLWSGQWGQRWVHVSRSQQAGRWRWHGGKALIPLPLFAVGSERQGWRPWASERGPEVRLQCACGRQVGLGGERFVCTCGREWGRREAGVARVGAAMPYWGEIPQAEMQRVLARARAADWRTAVRELVPEGLAEYVGDPQRAAFHELLPLPAEARILDVGAGWGGIAAALARHYEVVALEGVAERAQWIALRGEQEGLERLRVVQGDVHQTPLALGQFDAIIANGILEWVALMDHSAAPTAVQLSFLQRLRDLLAPGGMIYLAIENRFGWAEFGGALDHSGLRYTSLLPRMVARWVCARSRRYRAHFNVGYRTYTYSFGGYQDLFRQVGLELRGCWISPLGYNRPEKLVPLHTGAIRFSQRRGGRTRLRRVARWALGREGVWRRIGSDYVFLLQAEAGGERAAETRVAAGAPGEQGSEHA